MGAKVLQCKMLENTNLATLESEMNTWMDTQKALGDDFEQPVLQMAVTPDGLKMCYCFCFLYHTDS